MWKRRSLAGVFPTLVLLLSLITWAKVTPPQVSAQPIAGSAQPIAGVAQQTIGPPQQAPTPGQPSTAPAIRLRSATFAPSLGQKPALPDGLLLGTEDLTPGNDRGQYLVQFRGPILAAWRAEVQAAGATILDYIPDYAYKVEANAAALVRLKQLPDVIWVGDFQPGYRLSPEILPYGRQSGMQYIPTLRVELDGAPGHELLTSLPELGVKIIGQQGQTLIVEADAASLPALSRAAQVRWVSPASFPRPHNDRAIPEMRANLAWNLGYRGEGQMINIADTGLDTGVDLPQVTGDIHPDVDNRVEHIHSWPISPQWYGYLLNPTDDDGAADLDSGHGTHVAGSAMGNGSASNGTYRGVAPRASLTFQALEQYCRFNAAGHAAGFTDGYYLAGLPANLTDLYADAYGWGARISSNSWGSSGADVQGVYDAQSQQTDLFVWEHPDMAILFSVGNEARDANRDGRSDYASVVPPATAKNIIAVGAVENRRPELTPPFPYQSYGQFFQGGFPVDPIRGDPMADVGSRGMMAASGRGPTRDGRYAPQVVAPGTWIVSMRSSVSQHPIGWNGGPLDGHYMYLGGTSMSTPLVAGGVALVRQAYMARGHTPSAALLKATLIQAARDISGQYADPHGDAGPIPNDDEGWGAVDLQAAVAGGRSFVDQTTALHTGTQAVYTYSLNVSSQPARFTLVWTDYPGAIEAARQLVNDLDLLVTAPDGQTYLGNVFSGGWSVPGGIPDRANNVECVVLPSSQMGAYTVTIRGFNIVTPTGQPQDFALLVSATRAHPPRLRLPLVANKARFLAPGEFYDDFSTPNGLWAVTSTPTYTLDYIGGEYRIRVWPEKGKLGSLPSLEHAGDTVWEVDGRAANDVLQAYGLLFNYREDVTGTVDYDTFLVSPTGYYAVARWHNNGLLSLSNGWVTSTAIITGSATNHLAVRRMGRKIECFVNGVPVFSQSDPEFSLGAGLGVVALGYGPTSRDISDTRFDNYRMLPLGGGATVRMQQPSVGTRIVEDAGRLDAPPEMRVRVHVRIQLPSGGHPETHPRLLLGAAGAAIGR